MLKKFDDVGAVTANWVMYGTSFIYMIDPNKSLISQLCYRENEVKETVKSIIQIKRASHFINPHFVILKQGFVQMNEKKQEFEGPASPSFSVNLLRLNHYWTRDEKFFYEEKMKRQKNWSNRDKIDIDYLSEVFDNGIEHIYEKLK